MIVTNSYKNTNTSSFVTSQPFLAPYIPVGIPFAVPANSDKTEPYIQLMHDKWVIKALIHSKPHAPLFTLGMIDEANALFARLDKLQHKGNFYYLMWESRNPTCFSLGGHVKFFADCVRSRREDILRLYAFRAVDVIHNNQFQENRQYETVAYIDGKAFGGGMEFALSADYRIATPRAIFQLPEVQFGSFPGMGAYSFLVRRLGEAEAMRLIDAQRKLNAKDMLAIGLVDHVVQDQAEAYQWLMQRSSSFRQRNRGSLQRFYRYVPKSELKGIVNIWVDRMMKIGEHHLSIMEKIAKVQQRAAEKSLD